MGRSLLLSQVLIVHAIILIDLPLQVMMTTFIARVTLTTTKIIWNMVTSLITTTTTWAMIKMYLFPTIHSIVRVITLRWTKTSSMDSVNQSMLSVILSVASTSNQLLSPRKNRVMTRQATFPALPLPLCFLRKLQFNYPDSYIQEEPIFIPPPPKKNGWYCRRPCICGSRETDG